MKKLTRLFLALAVLLVLLAGILYARPVDVYTLGHLDKVDNISIVLSYFDEDLTEHALESVDLDAADPRFDPILERAEGLLFQRSPLDLVTRHVREGTLTGSPIQPDTYHYLLYLDDGVDYLQLQFFIDRWDYFTPSFMRNLPVQMKDAAEVGNDLGAFLWDMAQPVESNP